MKIAVIGSGYVGLTTGTCFAEMGNDVVCVDIDEQKILKLKNGVIPIYEPGLEELISRNSKSGRLNFSTDVAQAIKSSEIVFSAVGTPLDNQNHTDLQYVKNVAIDFGKYINKYKVFVNKSTVPVGTGDLCEEIIRGELLKRKSNLQFDVVSNPEFLREGCAIKDLINPDRIVIGVENERAKAILLKLYQSWIVRRVPILVTNIKTAEIIKYASNAMLATKISFINELANFCEKCGGNIREVARGMGLDKRIGDRFLHAGIGYGGSCFPKDINSLIETGKKYDYDFKIIKAVEEVNNRQREIFYEKLKNNLSPLHDKRVAIWGLSFKPKTDDVRHAPSITIIKRLYAEGCKISVYDPVAGLMAKNFLKGLKIKYAKNAYGVLDNADALMILTEWDEFRAVDLIRVKKLMKGNLVFDGRNIFEGDELRDVGLRHFSVGKDGMI